MSAAGLLDAGEATQLIESGKLLHTLTQIVRLSLDQPFDSAGAPSGLKVLLAKAAGLPDFAAVEARLREALTHVFNAFERLSPVGAAPARGRRISPRPTLST